MNLTENIKIALLAIRANLLRSILTLLIISTGIMALVGILTAIDKITASLNDNFSIMGANTFNIVRKGDGVKGNRRGRRTKKGPIISFKQAVDFKERFEFPAAVSVSAMGSSMGVIKYDKEKSNPNVVIYGGDENYLAVSGYEIRTGRNFTENEIHTGRNVAIVGDDVLNLLFNEKAERALGKIISVGNIKYKVIGVLKSKGSSLSMSSDRIVLVPLLNVKRFFGSATKNYNISVGVSHTTDMDNGIAAAMGTFRQVRKLKLSQEDDFEITASDSLVNLLEENTRTIRLATIFIGLITLLGAAIGLMNIMLVSVTERTREIGICKSLGATRNNILIQFLTEAVVICQLGGLLGVILGILAGNALSLVFKGGFIIPWAWMLLGITMCLVVGLIAGIYPAMKAARLDPIESLRHQ